MLAKLTYLKGFWLDSTISSLKPVFCFYKMLLKILLLNFSIFDV
jgi:hypothetical protein